MLTGIAGFLIPRQYHLMSGADALQPVSPDLRRDWFVPGDGDEKQSLGKLVQFRIWLDRSVPGVSECGWSDSDTVFLLDLC